MTIESTEPREPQLDEALSELGSLRRDLDALTRRVLVLERSRTGVVETETQGPTPDAAAIEDASVWSLVGESQLLPRVAIVCFALVLALVLRTLTENAVLGRELGVMLGIGYSAALVAIGVRLLARGSRGRRVLPVCGTLLLSTVLLEAQGPSGALSAATANWILLVALASLTAIGLRFRIGSILAFAALTTSATALAIGFPHPLFPHAATVILAGNVVAHLARRVGRMEWLSWTSFAVTVCLWLIWSFQANAFLRSPEQPIHGLHVEWFLPFVAAFATLFATLAVIRALGPDRTIGAFHAFLPTANVLWAYPAALAVVLPRTGDATALALVGGGATAIHFGLAAWMSRNQRAGAAAVAAFTLAGVVLFALVTPTLLGGFGLALPLWSALAVGIFAFGTRCGCEMLRVASYLLQILTCAIAVSSDLFAVPSTAFATDVLAAATIALLSATHFHLARTRPPAAGSWVLRVDRSNRIPIVMLWLAAIAAFGALRITSYQVITALGGDTENNFLGAQSVIVNCASIVLMLWGIRKRRGDILATAVLVATFSGLRLLASDLLTGQGIPLVLSVASFGAAAAVGSIVLSRWLAQRPATTGETDDSRA